MENNVQMNQEMAQEMVQAQVQPKGLVDNLKGNEYVQGGAIAVGVIVVSYGLYRAYKYAQKKWFE